MASSALWKEAFPFFVPKEFDARGKAGSGNALADSTLVRLLEARKTINKPFIITPNGGIAFEGHSESSRHYEHIAGDAADFYVASYIPYQEVLEVLLKVGFRGIGIYPQWEPKAGFHVDMREKKLMWIRIDKEYYYLS